MQFDDWYYRNHGPSAAEEYAKIQKAADQILNGVSVIWAVLPS